MTAKTRNLSLLVLLATSCLLSGCERSTHVRVKGGTTPVFVLSGSGKLSSFAVYSPDFAEKAESPWDENFALWKIRPAGGHLNGIPVRQLERITYGVLPDGYTQVKPQVGSAPPSRRGRNTSTKWKPLMPLVPPVTSKSGIHKRWRLTGQTHVSGARARSGFAFDAPSRSTITGPDTQPIHQSFYLRKTRLVSLVLVWNVMTWKSHSPLPRWEALPFIEGLRNEDIEVLAVIRRKPNAVDVSLRIRFVVAPTSA